MQKTKIAKAVGDSSIPPIFLIMMGIGLFISSLFMPNYIATSVSGFMTVWGILDIFYKKEEEKFEEELKKLQNVKAKT
jgi:membrane associated rhomboid family serine protease